ncbi:LOW QUALITY PROTEIN: hypothetical protein HZS_1484 [Henneguya salminicola]|nr:LOW QUALITY PROTEIN: hypothetical protein HZS_1484 [Henneguya salminicola]
MSSDFMYSGFSCRKNMELSLLYLHGQRQTKASFIVSNRNIVVQGEHVCKISTVTQSKTALAVISPEIHKNKFIDDKLDQLEIYPDKIYQELIISLGNKLKDIPFAISTKKIRKSRGYEFKFNSSSDN